MNHIISFALASALLFSLCAADGNGDSYPGYSYSGSDGPKHWKKTFPQCGGDQQSPIDIRTRYEVTPRNSIAAMPKPSYGSAHLKIERKPYNWGLECKDQNQCGSTTFEGKTYYLQGIHFHHQSEHTIKGRHFPLEMHMVQKAEDGSFAVLGTLFRQGPKNRQFEKFLRAIEAGESTVSMKLSGFIKRRNGYHVYDGSLTTPECTEGLKWMVGARKFTVSASQIKRYIKLAGLDRHGNSRPTQDLHNRTVYRYGYFH